MSKINRVPRGLQDYFGNVAAGENPDVLLADVRAVANLEPFWEYEKTKWVQTANAISAPGGGSFFTIPSGKIWIPIALGGQISGMVTGDTASLSVRSFERGANFGIPLAWTDTKTFLTAFERLACGFTWPKPTLYRSGNLLAVVADEFTYSGVPAIVIDAWCHYVELNV